MQRCSCGAANAAKHPSAARMEEGLQTIESVGKSDQLRERLQSRHSTINLFVHSRCNPIFRQQKVPEHKSRLIFGTGNSQKASPGSRCQGQ
mmetsp:Transcript_29049/g.43919  ORF Transcript_29049/g.43919 Transcript_29049/m.43919 type:complete len:91 (-) Transcript_29049:124-396(-)